MESKNNDPNKIRHWAEGLKDLTKDVRPARVQEVRLFADEILAIGFYQAGLVWLVFDLNNAAPDIYTVENLAELKKRETKKPLSLFMQAHFRGAKLIGAETRPEYGRVIWLYFDSCELEVRLFARGANAIARAGEKSVALRKPQELKPVETGHEGAEKPMRPTSKAQERLPAVNPLEKRIEKLKKALEKVEAELANKKAERWQDAGEQLKLLQTFEVAPEFANFVDGQKSLAWNIQNCFQKAKALQKKLIGTEARRNELLNQIAELERQSLLPAVPAAKIEDHQKKTPALLHDAEAKGRTVDLGSELFLFVGKSAADNLRILRKAKPWHFWLHLKDHPGSHGIITRNKNQLVDDKVLQKAAHHLLSAQFGAKAQRYAGEKFGVIVTECRFVRPIKGDRLGRVNYSDARTFIHHFDLG